MVVFRVDGNECIGMGHYMRCFAIAEELQRCGEDFFFLLAPDADSEAVREQGYPLYQMKMISKSLGWNVQEAANWLRRHAPVTLLIDTYRIDQKSMAFLIGKVKAAYYIDDLYSFDYPISSIINYNLEAKAEMYRDLVTGHPTLYLGPSYYPTRGEITCYKVKSLRADVRRVLVTTGSTDPLSIGLEILKHLMLCSQLKKVEFILLCGQYYKKDYVEELKIFQEQYQNVKLQGWTKEMGELYASCDICITPGSSSMSEAMTVGIPCISFAFVDNHLNQCNIMDEMGFAPYAGDYRLDSRHMCHRIKNFLIDFLDVEKRNFTRAKYAGLYDGKGARRIANILAESRHKKQRTNAMRQGETWIRIIGIRASAILYNFLLTNQVKGTVLMPANICECVPAIYKKTGMELLFCDIEFGTWVPNENEILSLLSSRRDITVLHYNRTYGEMGDHDDFFREVKTRFPSVIIVDDRCLSMPEWDVNDCQPDLILYSTGDTKPVNIGKGAFAFLKKQWKYHLYHLEGDINAAYNAFDASIKRCHAEHKSAEWDILLSNWIDPDQMPEDDYEQKVLQELANILSHKAALNDIYKNLPNSLPDGMHNWRYNILVMKQEKCLQKLFQEGLFASKHYLGLGNGYFSDVETPNCDWLAKHVINLFNDNKYTIEMAKRTVDICCKVERDCAL